MIQCKFIVVYSLRSDSLRPVDCRKPGFSVLHYLPEPAQTHVLRVSDAIQPSHPLSPLLLPSAFYSIRVFPMSQPFTSGGQKTGA